MPAIGAWWPQCRPDQTRRASSQLYGKRGQATRCKRAAEYGLEAGAQPQPREPLDQRSDRRGSLDAGEVGTYAQMPAAPERDMIVLRPGDIEGVGVGEPLRVSPG